jgi:exosortase A-associated hydrolase 2
LTETPFFFQGNGYRLFGVFHEASGPKKIEGFVLCAPFAEEKLWTHRVFVNFARLLAEKGYPVLRFDYMGHGDSEGDFEECSVKTMVSDIGCAVKALLDKVTNLQYIGILGLRFGATLALLAASSGNDFSRLILWEPIIDGSVYMREMLRINLATQTSVYKTIRYNSEALVHMMKEGKTVNVDGYEMALPLYEQISAIDLVNRPVSFTGKTLLVKIARKQGEIDQAVKNMQDSLGKCESVLAIEEPFWKEIKLYYPHANNLFRITLDWLEK